MQPNELKFTGIDVGEKSDVAPKPAKTKFLRYCLAAGLGGGLAADVLLLTFFTIPIGVGWYVALFWLCLAWSVLGAGSFFNRTCVAILVWSVGVLPIAPLIWMDYWHFNSQSHPIAILTAIAIPTYVAFWFYRIVRGKFLKLTIGHFQLGGKRTPRNQTALMTLFSLMTLSAILLAIAPATLNFFTGSETYEILMLAALAIPMVMLLPTIRLSCGVRTGGIYQAFQYLLVLCLAIGVTSTLAMTIVNGKLTIESIVPLIGLLVYFSAGGFLILGLSIIRDHGYRFGRIENPKRAETDSSR